MDKPDGKNKLLEQVDPSRRDLARRMLSGTAFVAPLIATFSNRRFDRYLDRRSR